MRRSGYRGSPQQLAGHGRRFLVCVKTGQDRPEKEYAQHGEEHEQLDEDENPQRPPPRHLAKTVAVKAPYVDKPERFHRNYGKYRDFLRIGLPLCMFF